MTTMSFLLAIGLGKCASSMLAPIVRPREEGALALGGLELALRSPARQVRERVPASPRKSDVTRSAPTVLGIEYEVGAGTARSLIGPARSVMGCPGIA